MERLNLAYIDLLQGPGSPSEKFWALSKRIREDKRHPGVSVELRRFHPDIFLIIATFLQEEIITETDINDFSEEFKEPFFVYMQMTKKK